MELFDALIQVAETLLGPKGCPWDQKQTFSSLQPYVLEEAHEVIEAVDSNQDDKIIEELGDLMYTIIFYAKLGEKQKRFSLEQIIQTLKEKLIRRHPHVFGEITVDSEEEIVKNWEKIKAREKGESTPSNFWEGVPPTLPTLVKAQKMLKRILRHRPNFFDTLHQQAASSEEQIGDNLLGLILSAEREGIDVESALRRSLKKIEDRLTRTVS